MREKLERDEKATSTGRNEEAEARSRLQVRKFWRNPSKHLRSFRQFGRRLLVSSFHLC